MPCENCDPALNKAGRLIRVTSDFKTCALCGDLLVLNPKDQKERRIKMEPKIFDEIMELQLSACREVLKSKENIYSSGGDRFGNFVKAGELQGRTPESALFGHLSKHLIAISDNVDNPSAKSFPAWTEWITDSMNYLILLRGMIEERMGRRWKTDGINTTKPFAKVFQPTQNVTLDESDLSLCEIDQS